MGGLPQQGGEVVTTAPPPVLDNGKAVVVCPLRCTTRGGGLMKTLHRNSLNSVKVLLYLGKTPLTFSPGLEVDPKKSCRDSIFKYSIKAKILHAYRKLLEGKPINQVPTILRFLFKQDM